jgi:imidazole glycerol-phosphate synthase subunit HisF
MLKVRIIPILTFNGFGLVKTKKFSNPRMVGNPVQAARVYNSRGVDELAFIDIFATKQKRKINLNLVKDVIRQCFMPVSIGGGIQDIDDINALLRIGADKVIIKSKALTDPDFIKKSVEFFGSQCISISVDVIKENDQYRIYNDLGLNIGAADFIAHLQDLDVGEMVLNSVDNDGMMQGFDIGLIKELDKTIKVPVIVAGGGGQPSHFVDLFCQTNIGAVGAASIYHFTQYTPLDVKNALHSAGKPVRIV